MSATPYGDDACGLEYKYLVFFFLIVTGTLK